MDILIVPLVNMLLFLYGLFGNSFVMAIIVATILIRMITLPLTLPQQRNSRGSLSHPIGIRFGPSATQRFAESVATLPGIVIDTWNVLAYFPGPKHTKEGGHVGTRRIPSRFYRGNYSC